VAGLATGQITAEYASILLFFFFLKGNTRAPLCLQWRRLVELFRKKDSRFYWYDFKVHGNGIEVLLKKLTRREQEGLLPCGSPKHWVADRRAPSLQEFSIQFLRWVESATLARKTRKYYANGWRRLSSTKLVRIRLDHITKDDVDALRLIGSASNINCALRTLRRMLHKAEEWNLLIKVPPFKLLPEHGRKLRLDDDAEQKLLLAAKSCNWKPAMFDLFRDVIILARDTGMRNGRELYRIRTENLDWSNRIIFVPDSKTPEGRRMIPMTDRVYELLRIRAAGKAQGWLFPSTRSECGHLTDLGKQFRLARRKAQLSEGLVLYCARHDYGTRVLTNTGNLAAVMRTMGHRDVRAAMQYQHPDLEIVRSALNRINRSSLQTAA
jgi:Phage integrase family